VVNLNWERTFQILFLVDILYHKINQQEDDNYIADLAPPTALTNIGLTERRKTKREEGKVAVMAVLAFRGMK
jgi:hypothetical protein